MRYVDGYVLAVPKKKIGAYKKMAALGAKIWMKHGALEYRECVGDQLTIKGTMPFGRTVRAKPNETVVFAYVVFKSRAHRDRVNAKVMKDPQMQPANFTEMPFDIRRMAYGGFRTLVEG